MTNKTYSTLFFATLLSLSANSYSYDAWDGIFGTVSYDHNNSNSSSDQSKTNQPNTNSQSYDAWDAIFSEKSYSNSAVSPE